MNDLLELIRPLESMKKDIEVFFDLVIDDTFLKNGIDHLEEAILEEKDDKRKTLMEDFNSQGQKRYFLLAVIEDKIVGSIEFGPSNDLIDECTNGELKTWYEVGTVYVHPEYQKKGVSKLLYDAITEVMKSRGIGKYCLDSGYPIAQKIWTRRFGKPDYHLKDFWGPGSDHMVWKVFI